MGNRHQAELFLNVKALRNVPTKKKKLILIVFPKQYNSIPGRWVTTEVTFTPSETSLPPDPAPDPSRNKGSKKEMHDEEGVPFRSILEQLSTVLASCCRCNK